MGDLIPLRPTKMRQRSGFPYAGLPMRNDALKGSLLNVSYDFNLSVNYTDTQFLFKFKLPSTKSIDIIWGNGDKETVTGQDSTLITKTSNYSTVKEYTFSLDGDYLDITYIDISNQSFVSGDVSAWNVLTTVREPLLAFILDDGYTQDLTVAQPLLASKGQIGNSAIITNVIGTAGKLSAAQILQLQSDGWEIQSHSKTHVDLRTLGASDLTAEMVDSKAALETLGVTAPIQSIIYPLGYDNATVDAEALLHYRAGFRSQSYFPTTRGFALYPFTPGSIERLPTGDYAITTWLTAVDEAAYTWLNACLIFYNHGIYLDAETQTKLGQLLDYINTKGYKLKKVSEVLNTLATYKECDLHLTGTGITFASSTPLWTCNTKTIDLSNCNLTATQVDNALIALAKGCHYCTIYLAGNNARRTAASDSAIVTLNQNGNTVDVNNSYLKFQSQQSTSLNQVDITFKIDSGKTVYIDWGEGSPVQLTADGSEHTFSSNYSTVSKLYTMTVYGDIEYIRTIKLGVEHTFKIDVTQLSRCTSLNELILDQTYSSTGDISLLTSLTKLNLGNSNNTLTGALTNLVNLITLWVIGTNTISGSINGLTSVIWIILGGNNTVSGNMENISASATYMQIYSTGNTVTYGGGATKTWNAAIKFYSGWSVATLSAFLIAWSSTAHNNDKNVYLGDRNASMADTNQGGIWGNFSGSAAPSTLATALKTLVRSKSKTIELTGIAMPGVSGDGTGFPAGFGDWYRS